MSRTTLAAWNVNNNRGLAPLHGVRALIRANRPTVLALSEARGVTLRAIKLHTPRYWHFAPHDYPRQDAALLVSKRATVSDHGVRWVDVPWEGPEDTDWTGKALPWAVVDGVLYVAVHNVWNPDANEAASDAVLDTLADMVAAHGGPAVLVGDWNLGERALRRFARRVGGEFVPGERVDGAVLVGLTGKGKPGKRFGSDHASVVYTTRPVR